MKLLGINVLLYFYSLALFSQCGEYLDYKFKADSCYKKLLFNEASIYYRKCLNYREQQRVDYYYLSCCLIRVNKKDSALYFYKIGAKEGLHYYSLKDFSADTVIQNNANLKEWKKTISIVKRNTEKFVSKINSNTGLLQTILERKNSDQKYRYPGVTTLAANEKDSLWEIQKLFDKDNQEWLKKEIEQNGWPSISKVGQDGDNGAWLIAQHSDNDTAFQQYCLTILKKQLMQHDTNPKNIAYLEDRILINSNKEQVYGTQFEEVMKNNKVVDLKLKPTIDIECLNKRRISMGLEPIENYLEFARKRHVQD